KTPLGSVRYQMLSSLAAIAPSVSAGPKGIVATTLLVAISTRDRVLSSQFGTHTLPNAPARPEQGKCPTGMVTTTLLVLGSSRVMVFFGLFPLHTESGKMRTQSGLPGTGNTASG